MKKILFILSLFIINNVSFAQVKVGSEGNIIPTGIYPALKSADLKGSIHPFQTIIQRNDLPANYRDTGMIAYVGDSTKYYSLIGGIANSNWQEFSGGGSTNIDSLVKYYVPCPDSTCWYGLNWNRDTLYKWKAVYDTSGGSGGISYYQLDSTATAVRADIPAQFNPIAGTNITTTGTYPNITFNASGGTYTLPIASASILGGVKIGSGLSIDGSGILSSTGSGGSVTNVSANAPLSVTNPTTTPNIVADTSKSQGKLATFNDVLIHKDSSAYHTSQVIGDSLLVLCDLLGRCDTFSLSAINIWNKNGNAIYYKLGNVGIGTDTPLAKLVVRKDNLGIAPADSSGITLYNATLPTVSSSLQSSPPLTFMANGWNTTTSLPAKSYSRIFSRSVTNSSGGNSFSNIIFQTSTDGITYTDLAILATGLTVYGPISGTGGVFSNSVTANGISISNGNSLFGLTKGNFGIGNTSVLDPSAIVQITSTSQGFLPPGGTKVQRDSINLTIASVTVTNVGSGFTSVPNVIATTSTANNSNPSATFTVTLSGSSIGTVTVTRGGVYNNTPLLSFTSGGGGTGATLKANMVQVLPVSLEYYCTDCTATDGSTGVKQSWNGTTWKNNW